MSAGRRDARTGSASGCPATSLRTRPRPCWATATGWPWWPRTTTVTGCGSCTCSSPGGPDRRVELEIVTPARDPACRRWRTCRSRRAGSSGRCSTSTASCPVGHPRPRRLVRHAHWPEAWYPMRRDAGPAPPFEPDGRFPFVTVDGSGVYEIPVGPVHAGLIEPGHFRFSVVGETVLRLKARLWFVHRGIEKLFEGRPAGGCGRPGRTNQRGHLRRACARAQPGRSKTRWAWRCPNAVHRLRALLVELERLYNHATDLGALANDVGFGAGQCPRSADPRAAAATQRRRDRTPVAARRHPPRAR